jgi:DNA-binding response OmpR family regulator
MKTKKILYVEDMKECFERTRNSLGRGYSVDWRETLEEGAKALCENEYSAVLIDINLYYDPSKPSEEQTKEGLKLVELAREISDTPIICISARNNREESLRSGADLFMFKKEFWRNGKETLEGLLQ